MSGPWSGLLAETSQQCIKAIPVHVQAVPALANCGKTVQTFAELKSMPAGRRGLDCRARVDEQLLPSGQQPGLMVG